MKLRESAGRDKMLRKSDDFTHDKLLEKFEAGEKLTKPELSKLIILNLVKKRKGVTVRIKPAPNSQTIMIATISTRNKHNLAHFKMM